MINYLEFILHTFNFEIKEYEHNHTLYVLLIRIKGHLLKSGPG